MFQFPLYRCSVPIHLFTILPKPVFAHVVLASVVIVDVMWGVLHPVVNPFVDNLEDVSEGYVEVCGPQVDCSGGYSDSITYVGMSC